MCHETFLTVFILSQYGICLFLNAGHTSFTVVCTQSLVLSWQRVSLQETVVVFFLGLWKSLTSCFSHLQDGTRILCFTLMLLGSHPQNPLLSPGWDLLDDHHLTSIILRLASFCFSMSRAYYGNINFFGGPSTTAVKTSAKLKQLEEENEDAMFVVVSDVWLDSVEVLEKIHNMFAGKNNTMSNVGTVLHLFI